MRRTLRACLLLWLLAVSQITFAAEVDESLLQMLYLRNFIDYTSWPDHHAPEVLTIMGDEALKPTITTMQQQHAFAVPTIRYCATISCAQGSDILFIGRHFRRSEALLASLAQQRVLTVSNQPDFIDHGGMIGMFRHNNHLYFEVNLRAIRAARLHISAELLQMADRIIGNNTP